MENFPFERELRDYLALLEPEQQRQVLEYARTLGHGAPRRGVPGEALLRFVGTMEPLDVMELSQAIAADCETVDPDAW